MRALFLVTAASAQPLFSNDIFRLTCDGSMHLFPGSKVEAAVNVKPLLALLDNFYTAAKTKATKVCPSLSDAEFRRRFVPGLESVINHLDQQDMSTTCDNKFFTAFTTNSPWTQIDRTDWTQLEGASYGADVFTSARPSPLAEAGGIELLPLGWILKLGGFEPETAKGYWIHSGVDGIELPQTCSYETLKATGSCAFAIRLDRLSVKLQVALATCSGSYMPAISVTCAGEGCPSVFTPCTNDASCAGTLTCKALDGADEALDDAQVNKYFRDAKILGRQDDSGDNDDATKDTYMPGFAQLNKLMTAMAPFLGITMPANLTKMADFKVCGPSMRWGNFLFEKFPGSIEDDLGCSTPAEPAAPAAQVACVASGCPSVRMVGDGVCDPACQTTACLGDGSDCQSAQVPAFGPVTRSNRTTGNDIPAPYILTKKTVCTSVETWNGKLAAGGQALSPVRMAGSDLTPTAAGPATGQASHNRKSAAAYSTSVVTRAYAHLLQFSTSTATGAWASTQAIRGLPSAPRFRTSKKLPRPSPAGWSNSRRSALPPKSPAWRRT